MFACPQYASNKSLPFSLHTSIDIKSQFMAQIFIRNNFLDIFFGRIFYNCVQKYRKNIEIFYWMYARWIYSQIYNSESKNETNRWFENSIVLIENEMIIFTFIQTGYFLYIFVQRNCGHSLPVFYVMLYL